MQHVGPKGSFFSARDITKVLHHQKPRTSRENAKTKNFFGKKFFTNKNLKIQTLKMT